MTRPCSSGTPVGRWGCSDSVRGAAPDTKPESMSGVLTIVKRLIAVAALCAASFAAPTAGAQAGRPIVLLVHGRGMLGRDTAGTRKLWADGLATGAKTLTSQPLLDSSDVRVVWYADVLDPASNAGCDYAPDDPRARRAAKTDPGVTSFISFAGGLLGGLSALSGDTSSDNELRELAADASFLGDSRKRCAAEERLADALARARAERRPVILVGHSLGSVVAYDYLSARPDTGLVQRFVTIGCPLGATNLRELLIGGDSTDQLVKPRGIKDWINIRHADDQLAAPLAVARDTVVDAPAGESDAHEMVGYLRGGTTAREILGGWCAAFTTARPQGCNEVVSK